MAEILPDDIKRDLLKAYRLHDRAVADYARCCEFSKVMSELLTRLEDAGYYRTADRGWCSGRTRCRYCFYRGLLASPSKIIYC
ncbi:MAG: hypothetical protein ACWGOX_15575 [Desulforhopalus sp.]